MTCYLTREEVREAFPNASWQRIVFAEFEATLTSGSRPFPCIFGVTGLKSDMLRYAFIDPLDPASLAPILGHYVANARGIGRMTSLVVFARPGPVQSIEAYRDRFWTLLDGLARLDPSPRPDTVPEDLDSDRWEFCFGGEPIFVVCNSPAHVLRQSRRSTSFMITFQPRWVFEGITDSEEPSVLRALDNVRARLADFDVVEPAPFLGAYGTPGNREYQQYFIGDSNAPPACPFHALGMPRDKDATNDKGKVA